MTVKCSDVDDLVSCDIAASRLLFLDEPEPSSPAAANNIAAAPNRTASPHVARLQEPAFTILDGRDPLEVPPAVPHLPNVSLEPAIYPGA